MTILSRLPVVSTDHIARYFADRGSPAKRASEYLCYLESQRLLESQRRAIGQPKVWRLSKKGREQQNIDRRPVSLTSNKIPHYLALADAYQALRRRTDIKLLHWAVELREPFKLGSRSLTYCPDAFFTVERDGKRWAYLLEVQQSPLTSNRWAEKWAMATAFFDSDAVTSASFQVAKGHVLRPAIVVLTPQQPETVQGGSKLPIIITKTIAGAPL